MSFQSKAFHRLFRSLNARSRPEDITEIISEVLSDKLTKKQSRVLAKASKNSSYRTIYAYTSMLQEFSAPSGLQTQVRKSEELFERSRQLSKANCSEPAALEIYLRSLSDELHKKFGQSDFNQRLNREERLLAGMDISKRRYNKLFRLLGRMENKLNTLIRELKKLEFTKIGKSSLASKLTWLSFASDVDTGCFVAYYTARCNLRSEFTISGQEQPYDEIAAMLLDRCTSGEANYWAIAHVYPVQKILMRLTEQEKGELLAEWYEILVDISGLLHQIWETSNITRSTMIVKRGDDSTTWNNTANAWNKARNAWIAMLYSMNMASVLDAVCPGKVLRLMAADVVAWHHNSGGGLDPDTQVWNSLPLPWRVLSGEQRCNREFISHVCRESGVSDQRGWIAPHSARKAVAFRATPELVHGVNVGSPALAAILRKAGWFSGKVSVPVMTH